MVQGDFVAHADDPISTFEQDHLNRKPFADRLAAVLKAAPVNSSSVFALYGEWGSGKTSVKNLVARRWLEDSGKPGTPIWIEFNPWAFSTQAELFQSFFVEISKALGRKDAGEVAVAVSKLGSYLSIGAKAAKAVGVVADLTLLPGAGIAGMLAETLENGGQHAKEYADLLQNGKMDALEDVRNEVRAALEKLGRSILIVIDDLDRLPPPQILQMFQVIRANASLPKINFLLLMDRRSIVHALEQSHHTADYLEKIVQFALDIPHVGPGELRGFAKAGLESIATEANLNVDWERWDIAYKDGCQQILDTPRKIRRLLHTFRFHLTIFAQDGVPEVDFTDLFLLEVVRLYAPDLWLRLPLLGQSIFHGRGLLAWYLDRQGKRGSPQKEEFADALKAAPAEIQEYCKEIVCRLLPQLGGANELDELTALSTCRMCSSLHFESYFLLRTNAGYPTQAEAVAIVSKLQAPETFLVGGRILVKRYGFSHFLGKLQAIQKDCVHRGTIETMIGAVWRLDEEDAASAPVDGEWHHRENTENFTRYFLGKLHDEAERVQVAESALAASGAVHPLVFLSSRDLARQKENPHRTDFLFSEKNVAALQKLCGARVAELREKDRLVFHPNLQTLLALWSTQDSREVVHQWVKEQSKDDVRLAIILSQFFSRSISEGNVKFFISARSIERWFDIDAGLKARLAQTDDSRFDRWQRLAVQEVVRIIEHKEKGIKEAVYPGAPD